MNRYPYKHYYTGGDRVKCTFGKVIKTGHFIRNIKPNHNKDISHCFVKFEGNKNSSCVRLDQISPAEVKKEVYGKGIKDQISKPQITAINTKSQLIDKIIADVCTNANLYKNSNGIHMHEGNLKDIPVRIPINDDYAAKLIKIGRASCRERV